MKYIKTYENRNMDKSQHNYYLEAYSQEPQIGDWVICIPKEIKFHKEKKELYNIFSENIGHITDMLRFDSVIIEYDDINAKDDNLLDYFRYEEDSIIVKKSDILYCFKNKEDAQTFLTANKYNL